MLDYDAIATLAAIIETQGFQEAAQKLFITQSAVSQRIKSLESQYGEPVLVRTLPYRPTRLGLKLLGHFKKVSLLEQDFHASADVSQHISIAISRDSLETWFKQVIDQLKSLPSVTLEIIADDQEKTLAYLQNGIVAACASTSEKSPAGCKSDFLGYFDYILVASPAFAHKYFSNEKHIKKNLIQAPSIMFDQNDCLHEKYLQHFFHLDDQEITYNVIPSVAGFRQFALLGYAYALIPYIDIIHEIKQKKLINLFPNKVWKMPVYWHSWNVESKIYKQFNHLVAKTARHALIEY